MFYIDNVSDIMWCLC